MKPWHGKTYLEVQLRAPSLAAGWIWGWLDKFPPWISQGICPKTFLSLSLFQGMYYRELHFLLSLQHVLIYRMRFVIIEFRAECWAFPIAPGVFLGTRWIAQYASRKRNNEWINKYMNNSMPHFAYILARGKANSLSIRNVFIMQKWQSRCTYSKEVY